jgi:hypothetical protein
MHSQSGVDRCKAVVFKIGPQNIEVGEQLLSTGIKGEQAKGQFKSAAPLRSAGSWLSTPQPA